MPMWNPWRGCRKCSEGCRYCYIHKGDARRGVDTSQIVRTSDFDKPVRQLKKGGYKMKPGLVYLGFSTDFLIEKADPWRADCWKMIRERQDCTFLFLTKRIERFSQCIPDDWADGYENVTVCCTIENQQSADRKLPVFCSLPVRHRCITAQPLLERVNLEPYLDGVELVVVGGESDRNARFLDYDWALDLRAQCIRKTSASNFASAAPTLSKTAGAIRSKPETCAARRALPASITPESFRKKACNTRPNEYSKHSDRERNAIHSRPAPRQRKGRL